MMSRANGALSPNPVRFLIGCFAIVFSMAANSAMHLSPSGSGQVLIFPYYAATSKIDTLLSIFNHSDQSKAVRVRFIEGLHGQTAAQFNLYLAPRDVWVGAVSNRGGTPTLASSDESCTVPAITSSGIAVQNQFDLYYAGSGTSGEFPVVFDNEGDESHIDATGLIEVIEMAVVKSSSMADLIKQQGESCAVLSGQWDDGGTWAVDREDGLSAPAGALSGTASLINVAEGIEYGYRATAIDGFFVPAPDADKMTLHRSPSDVHPDLTDANTSGAGSDPGVIQTMVIDRGRPIVSNWPSAPIGDSSRADPVSALLMVGTLHNEAIIDSSLDGRTNWIVTYPTLRHYSANSIGPQDAPLGPIEGPFTTQTSGYIFRSVLGVWIDQFHRFWNREGTENDSVGACSLICHDRIDVGIGVAQLIIAGGGEHEGIGSGLREPLFGLNEATQLRGEDGSQALFRNGHAEIEFESTDINFGFERTLVSAPDPETGEFHIYHGLPALGFAAIRIVNGDVTAGSQRTRANYGRTADHVGMRRIEIIHPER